MYLKVDNDFTQVMLVLIKVKWLCIKRVPSTNYYGINIFRRKLFIHITMLFQSLHLQYTNLQEDLQ